MSILNIYGLEFKEEISSLFSVFTHVLETPGAAFSEKQIVYLYYLLFSKHLFFFLDSRFSLSCI
jgi:hypothetical protein